MIPAETLKFGKNAKWIVEKIMPKFRIFFG